MNISVKHYLMMHYDPSYMEKPEFGYYTYNMSSHEAYTLIKEVDFDLVIPDEFDPKAEMIAKLEQSKQKARADFQVLMDTIEGKIQSLKAIEYKSESNIE